MKTILRSLAFAVALAAPAAAQSTAFENVGVVTMKSASATPRQTVVVEGDRIVAIGPAGQVAVPANAQRIDGTGLHLMPGLVDGHVHTFEDDERWLFLAHGITTVVNWHGTAQHLQWRDAVEAGERVGPRMKTAGPILDGTPPTRQTNTVVNTAAEARVQAEAQAAAGYDFFKVYDNLSPDAYSGLLAVSREKNIPVIGHVPTPIGFEAFTAGAPQLRAIQHLEEYTPFVRAEDVQGSIDRMAQTLAEKGVFSIPTIVVHESSYRHRAGAPEDWSLTPPAVAERWGWQPTVDGRKGKLDVPAFKTSYDRHWALLRAFHAKGVQIVAGSDTPMATLTPGRAFLEELSLYKRAGMSNYDVLQTATVNAAAFLKRANGGDIEVGSDADLLLVRGDPLQDLAALNQVEGVMVKGKWTGKDTIEPEVKRIRETAAGLWAEKRN